MVKPDWEPTRKELIETYKTLNFRVRGRAEDDLMDALSAPERAQLAALLKRLTLRLEDIDDDRHIRADTTAAAPAGAKRRRPRTG